MNAYPLEDDRVLRLLSYRGCIIEPLRQTGRMESGLYAADAYDRHTPFVLARILHRHESCTDVQVGDVVVTNPHAFERVVHESGEFFLMHENNALAVIEGYDAAGAKYAIAEFPRREADGNDTDVTELAIQSA